MKHAPDDVDVRVAGKIEEARPWAEALVSVFPAFAAHKVLTGKESTSANDTSTVDRVLTATPFAVGVVAKFGKYVPRIRLNLLARARPATRLAQGISSANRQYGRCFGYAKELVGALQGEGIRGSVLVVRPQVGLTLVNSKGRQVAGQSASHVGIEVDGLVYDNFSQIGVRRDAWLRDLGVGEAPIDWFPRTFEEFIDDISGMDL
jgi:hypothetical protein